MAQDLLLSPIGPVSSSRVLCAGLAWQAGDMLLQCACERALFASVA